MTLRQDVGGGMGGAGFRRRSQLALPTPKKVGTTRTSALAQRSGVSPELGGSGELPVRIDEAQVDARNGVRDRGWFPREPQRLGPGLDAPVLRLPRSPLSLLALRPLPSGQQARPPLELVDARPSAGSQSRGGPGRVVPTIRCLICGLDRLHRLEAVADDGELDLCPCPASHSGASPSR